MKKSILSLFVAGLFGCTGTAVVLQEDTEDVGELIEATVDSMRVYYAEQGQQKFDFIINFMAARPSCAAESPLLLLTETSQCLTDEQKLRRRACMENQAAHANCDALLAAQRAVVSPQITQPRQMTVSLINAVASYQRALAKVLRDENYDTAADLQDLRSRLLELNNRVRELGGEEPEEESEDEELDLQIGAIGAIVDLIASSNEDTADFNALRSIVVDRGPAIDAALESLLSTYERIDRPLTDLFARSITERSRNIYNDMTVAEREAMDFEERAEFLRAIYEAEFLRQNAAARPDAIATGLRGLIRSHKQLQKGFSGDLTSEQRRRIAEENRRQLKAVFESMRKIIDLFA